MRNRSTTVQAVLKTRTLHEVVVPAAGGQEAGGPRAGGGSEGGGRCAGAGPAAAQAVSRTRIGRDGLVAEPPYPHAKQAASEAGTGQGTRFAGCPSAGPSFARASGRPWRHATTGVGASQDSGPPPAASRAPKRPSAPGAGSWPGRCSRSPGRRGGDRRPRHPRRNTGQSSRRQPRTAHGRSGRTALGRHPCHGRPSGMGIAGGSSARSPPYPLGKEQHGAWEGSLPLP